ncbi:unnamed protein product [Meloidogyne enterolobii]|uniref:Uncharacterized protein n=1 Tax=Meloidogyne enterolobii TaxID=390850 RepID=A0ACB0ZW20_MELEN
MPFPRLNLCYPLLFLQISLYLSQSFQISNLIYFSKSLITKESFPNTSNPLFFQTSLYIPRLRTEDCGADFKIKIAAAEIFFICGHP